MLFESNGIFGIEVPSDVYNPSEGFMYGNMFPELYNQYKSYIPLKVVGNNDKELLLIKIYTYDFAINDLNLYLDIYPNDQEKYLLFKEYVNELNKLEHIYEEKYGPLNLNDTESLSYTWYKNPWPWESGESIYV